MEQAASRLESYDNILFPFCQLFIYIMVLFIYTIYTQYIICRKKIIETLVLPLIFFSYDTDNNIEKP